MITDELNVLIGSLPEVAYLPGGIDRLRRAILESAMQGMLTGQVVDSMPAETASELLDRITQAKLSYMGSGRNFTRTGKSSRGNWSELEALPSGWVWTTVGEITTKVGSGSTPRGGRNNYVKTGPIFLRSQNIWNDGLRLEGVAHIPAETHTRMAGTHVMPHDVLLNITGASIGRAALAPPNIGECNVSQHVMIIRPAIPEIAPFLHLYIISPRFRKMIDDAQVGISRDGLSKQSAMAMPVPLPPLREQDRITVWVNSAFALLARLERELAEEEAQRSQLAAVSFRSLASRRDRIALDIFEDLLCSSNDVDELEAAIVQLAVEGALTTSTLEDSDIDQLIADAELDALDKPQLVDKNGRPIEDPFTLPPGWRWVVLGSMLTDIQGGWSPAAQPRPKEGDEWGVLKVSACSWGKFRPSENKALQSGQEPRPALEVKIGDFLISRANTAELVGKSVVVHDTPPHLMLSDKTLRMRVVNGCNPLYLNLANLSRVAREHYEREATGTSRSMKNVSQRIIRRTPIPLPPRAEQDRIIAVVNELMTLLRKLRLKLAA
jgi:type I restriction enzyme S subunit